jgi:deoxyribodipyrimidine photo-lyase
MEKVALFWFRRDLRLEDNTALHHALASGFQVIPLFIFDQNLLENLPKNDARVTFIYETLHQIHQQLTNYGSSLQCFIGKPHEVWEQLISTYSIVQVYINNDYEPYALERDQKLATLLAENNISLFSFKDQVVFEAHDILKNDGKPYSIFTPYKNKWLAVFNAKHIKVFKDTPYFNFYKSSTIFPTIESIGFKTSSQKVKPINLSKLHLYTEIRNIPSEDSGSYLGPHLRFGTLSIRQLITSLKKEDDVFLSELIWREFFMQILYHFPKVVFNNFKSTYDAIVWRNNEDEFKHWCNGTTGYPLVDAGMHQLNLTGYLHNRVRMVVASFLCKHLLIDWRWGEAYFAEKLLDYELASNNGNWQWAAGTGCDAAPYFRVFNPTEQQKKFDKNFTYIKQWIPDFDPQNYLEPIVEHPFARQRALEAYKNGLKKYN